MARFDTNGLDALILDMNEIESIDNDTIGAMLEAGGKVIQQAHVEQIRSNFSVRSGRLIGSPAITPKRSSGDSHYVLVYPKGEHHTTKNGKVQGNNDVGFVHEFGGHGNAPTQWMRTANEQNADKAVDAEFAVFDKFITKHNL